MDISPKKEERKNLQIKDHLPKAGNSIFLLTNILSEQACDEAGDTMVITASLRRVRGEMVTPKVIA